MHPDPIVLPNAEPSQRWVGVPTHERALTKALLGQVPHVLRSGPGRSVYVLEEVQLGAGRPDVVLLAASPAAVSAFRRTGLRIPSPVGARVLSLGADLNELGVSVGHARALKRQLTANGWSSREIEKASTILSDSLGIEAKVKDWRQAVRQVSRFRQFFRRSAVLMPSRTILARSSNALTFYGCGLLLENEARVQWARDAVAHEPPAWTKLWLLELLVRGLESGTAYRSTDSTKSVSARE